MPQKPSNEPLRTPWTVPVKSRVPAPKPKPKSCSPPRARQRLRQGSEAASNELFYKTCCCLVHLCVSPSDSKEDSIAFSPFFLFISPFNCRGAGHHMRVPAQRRGFHVDAEAVWDAKLCTCSLYRSFQEVRIELRMTRKVRLP